ncbi:MAG: hypothetical protein JSS93_10395 [Bacteroidetes bacterium]|nr:hypothetical protein [Bacteroidota bacterium]
MKKELPKKIVLLLIVISTFTKCQNPEVKKSHDVIDFNQIGIEHNKGLDYIFNELKSAKSNNTSGRISTVENLNVVTSSGTKFILTNHLDFPASSIAYLKKRAAKSNTFFKNYLSNKSINSRDAYQIMMDSMNAF